VTVNQMAQRRVVQRSLPAAPRIRYTRKSTEENDRQIASHEQQTLVMNDKWGPTNTGIHFQDSLSGTTFDRPGFQEMLEFCRTHRQDKALEKGLIEIYDMSRFGRILSDGEEDPEAVLSMMKQFLRYGWEIRFVTFESTGNKVMDFFQNGLYSIMASEVSKKLQRDVRRGRMHFLTLESGARWLGGRRAPFGTVRIDPTTKKVLAFRERAVNRGGTILGPNEEELTLWVEAANMLLAKKTYAQIAESLAAKGARAEWRQSWDAKTIKWVLTNPVLIGEVHIEHIDPKTRQIAKKIYKAEWDALVDPALFHAVAAEVATRIGDGHQPHIYRGDVFVPTCAHCGCPYYYQQTRESGKTLRFYMHPYGKAGISPEWKQRIIEAGCRNWRISAPIVERALLDLILERRTSPDFALHLSDVMAGRSDLEDSAKRQREKAEEKLRKIEQAQKRTVANMNKAQERGLDDAIFWQQLSDLNSQIESAKQEKESALELEHVANAAWSDIQVLIDETRNIESIWASGDLEKRQEVLRWWVRELLIVVDKQPILGNGKTDPKYMVAFLRTAPTEGLDRALTRNAEPLKLESTVDRIPELQGSIPVAFFAPLPDYRVRAVWVPAASPSVGLSVPDYAVPAPESNRHKQLRRWAQRQKHNSVLNGPAEK
jgi:hypothetical protein